MAGVSPPRSRGMTITWLGHATVLLETADVRLLTDPVLRRRIAHLSRRTPDPEHPGHSTACWSRTCTTITSTSRRCGAWRTDETAIVIPAGAAKLLTGWASARSTRSPSARP